MEVEQICDRCGMSFDWSGVERGDAIYCCAACARGEPCTCVMEGSEADTVIVE